MKDKTANKISELIERNTYLECQITELHKELGQYKIMELKTNSCENTIDYEKEYHKLIQQLSDAKKVIKYLSSLI